MEADPTYAVKIESEFERNSTFACVVSCPEKSDASDLSPS